MTRLMQLMGSSVLLCGYAGSTLAAVAQESYGYAVVFNGPRTYGVELSIHMR